MDKVQKPSNSECYAPSSELFRIYTEAVVSWPIVTAPVERCGVWVILEE
jgi:hypothetical protein